MLKTSKSSYLAEILQQNVLRWRHGGHIGAPKQKKKKKRRPCWCLNPPGNELHSYANRFLLIWLKNMLIAYMSENTLTEKGKASTYVVHRFFGDFWTHFVHNFQEKRLVELRYLLKKTTAKCNLAFLQSFLDYCESLCLQNLISWSFHLVASLTTA